MAAFSEMPCKCGLWIGLYIYKIQNGMIAVFLCQVLEQILLLKCVKFWWTIWNIFALIRC